MARSSTRVSVLCGTASPCGSLSHRSVSLLLLMLCATLPIGCRRAEPPRFTPGPEVVELTADIEDAEELEVYKELQQGIAQKLRQCTGTPDKPILLGTEESTDKLKLGYSLYTYYCVQCHGVNGDGNGPVAEHLNPKPRNYTLGIFKFTSTPYGTKPRRADLVHTIKRGVAGTSMPSFDRFSNEQLDAVVEYVLALTYRGQLEKQLAGIAFDDEELPDDEYLEEVIADILTPWEEAGSQLVMPATPMPAMTEDTIRTGHQIFLSKGCAKCHGTYGRGGSMGNVDVGTDAWGNKTAAADLSSGMFRGGDRFIDVYRRIASGINGTPMPAFAKTFEDDPDAIWQLVHFIKETGNRRRQGNPPLSEADLPSQPTVDPESSQPSEDSEKEAA